MRRIGSHKERHVRVRLIAATNRDLTQAVKDGNFREDLFYRINVLSLNLPTLRERTGDIDRLIDHFLPANYHIDPAARLALNRYPWPGNIRQLINAIQRATVLSDSHDITLDDLPAEIAEYGDVEVGLSDDESETQPDMPETESQRGEAVLAVAGSRKLDDIARAHVMKVLASESGNKAKAARVLGIHRRKLYRLLERFEQQHCDSEAGVA